MSKQKMSAEDKKMVNGLFWNSFLLEASYNYERQQALGFSVGMWPAIKRFYKTKEGQAEALKRHMAIFNTTPHMVSVISGVTAAMEKEASENKDFDKDIINNVKVGLMGPLAGIGDSFFWGTLRIIAAGIGIGLCAEGNLLGVLIFVLLYGGSQVVARWYLLKIGYTMGTSFIDSIFSSGLMTSLTKSAAILGLSMVGAMVASMVNVKLAWTIQVGQTSVVVLDVVNSIMPGILSVALVFGLVALIKKGVRPVTLVLGILVLSVALAFFGIF